MKLSLETISMTLANSKTRVFGRIRVSEVAQDGTRLKARVRLNKDTYLTNVLVTKAQVAEFQEEGKAFGLIELPKTSLLTFLKTLPGDTLIGGNMSKKGHVYIKGIDSKEAVELGEMEAPTPRKKAEPFDGGAPAAVAAQA